MDLASFFVEKEPKYTIVREYLLKIYSSNSPIPKWMKKKACFYHVGILEIQNVPFDAFKG